MANDVTRIGLLFVHGVGEQKRFEHLESEARHLVRALKRIATGNRVTVSTRTCQNSEYLAEHVSWKADDGAPVRIHFDCNERSYLLELREVWWADLDERNTLWSQVKFWFWGLAQWADQVRDERLDDQLNLERKPSRLAWWITRVKLFLVAIVFSLVLITLSLANFVLSAVLKFRLPGPDIISSYVGDVKLITQQEYQTTASLATFQMPPRFAIRRRLVEVVVEMAMSGYTRWYIVAHSLGTVLAQNVLMETGLCLPNYLDEERWQRCRGETVGRFASSDPTADAEAKHMLPPRPAWLDAHDAIDRKALFKNLRGLLTYGSPLDKFATLWPRIVGINPEPALSAEFEWINVFDETDPIAGKLDHFIDPTPRNFAYSAFPWLLLSHLKYLAYKPRNDHSLVDKLCRWVVSGDSFPEPAASHPEWSRDVRTSRTAWRYAQWVAVVMVLAPLGGLLVNRALMLLPWIDVSKVPLTWAQYGVLTAWGLIAAVVVTAIAGSVRIWLQR